MKKNRLLSALVSFAILTTLCLPVFATHKNISDQHENVAMDIAGRTVAEHNQAIVLIPGIGGSSLYLGNSQVWITLPLMEDQLACNEYGTPKYTLSVKSPSTSSTSGASTSDYNTLYNALYNTYSDEYDVLFFPYDWRRSCYTNALHLKNATASYDNLILVAHSMGGIVASAYCADSAQNRNKVDKLITIGTPYTGAPKNIYIAETGDFHFALPDSTVKNLVKNYTSIYELLPTTQYTNSYGSYIQVGSTNYSGTNARNYIASRPWAIYNGSTKTMYNIANDMHDDLFVSGTHIANGSLVDTYKIVGTGHDTISKIIYNSNGVYSSVELNNSGDGTVPRYSASNNQTISSANQVYSISGEHTSMLSTASCINKIKDIINGAGTLSTSDISIQDVDVNEKGWLIGEDNRRIYITIDNSDDIAITDEFGVPFIMEGNYLYDEMGNNVGSRWLVGDNQIMFCMKNGQYSIVSENEVSPIQNLQVTYQNNGYDEYVETYETVGAQKVELSIAGYSNFGAECKIIPFKAGNMDGITEDMVPLTATTTEIIAS